MADQDGDVVYEGTEGKGGNWGLRLGLEFEIRSMGGDDMVAGGSKKFGIGIWGNEILIERKGWIGKKEGGEEKADDI